MSEELKAMSEEMGDVFGRVESKNNFFNYDPGNYTALLGRLIPKYKDANNEKCEADKPGAKLAYAMQELFILTAPYGNPVNEQLGLNEDIPAAGARYQRYTSLAPKDQWSSEIFYQDFTIEGQKGLDVVVKDGKTYIEYSILNRYYIGAKVSFDLVESKKKSGSLYIENVTLSSHKLTNDIIAARKQAVDTLIANVEQKIAAEKEARANEKEDSSAPVAKSPDASEASAIINGLID